MLRRSGFRVRTPAPVVALLLALATALLVLLGACAALDPRRHCTHPHHEEWVRERQAKGRPF